jgi:hypothetical protein
MNPRRLAMIQTEATVHQQAIVLMQPSTTVLGISRLIGGLALVAVSLLILIVLREETAP